MTGAKVFRLEGDTLLSPMQLVPWHTATLVGLCPDGPRPGECGIHAYPNLRAAVDAQFSQDQRFYHLGKDAIYAIVRPEGDTIVGEYGWVSESAEIIRIFLPQHLYAGLARALYDRYRVPVAVLPYRRWKLPPVLPAPRPADLWLMAHYAAPVRPELTRDSRGYLCLVRPRRIPPVTGLVRYDPAFAARYSPWRDYGLVWRVTHGKYSERYAEWRSVNVLPAGRFRRKRKPREVPPEIALRLQRRSAEEKSAVQWLIGISRAWAGAKAQ